MRTTLVFALLFCLADFESKAQGTTPEAPAIPSAAPSGPGASGSEPSIPTGSKKEEATLFDQGSPYLDYGDFNMTDEENEDAQYFQYGRFFGFSAGAGYQTATGNRGKLYEAAFPRIDLRVHYWFNFNFGIDLGVFFANHQYSVSNVNTQVKLIGYGMHIKYYFDVRDASAPLTFANPFMEVGIGAMSMAESSVTTTAASTDSTLSADLGGGFEFPIVHKKSYFILEALFHTQNFADNIRDLSPRVSDLTGGFMTLSGHFMFVW